MALLATVSMAAQGATLSANARGYGLANGSAECCICPICRVIAALRDPSEDLTDRLAHGAGDLATGIASMLRSLAGAHTDDRRSGPDDVAGEAGPNSPHRDGEPGDGDSRDGEPSDGDAWWAAMRDRATAASHQGDDPWRAATTRADDPWRDVTDQDSEPADTAAPRPDAPDARATTPSTPKPVVKKVAKKAVKKAAPHRATPHGAPTTTPQEAAPNDAPATDAAATDAAAAATKAPLQRGSKEGT
jgi:hypothetical protein